MKSGFKITAESPSGAEGNVYFGLAACGNCKQQIVAKFYYKGSGHGHGLVKAGGTNPLEATYILNDWAPRAQEPRIAAHIHDDIFRPLLEAEKAFSMGLYSAAGACYRKSIERAVKKLFPSGTGTLNKRIRELEKQGLLPNTMIDLLDQIRIFGNSTLHEDETDPSKEDCAAARDFSDLFLTYTFTLPAKIVETKSTAQGNSLEAPI
jgi:hypothetical protein